MKKPATSVLFLAVLLGCGMSAMAQNERSTAASTVTGLYVEQAPGLLIDARFAQGAVRARVAEVTYRDADGELKTRLVRVPDGSRVRIGDRTGEPGATAPATASSPRRPLAGGTNCIPLVAGR